jgi:cyclophilin family peptidyl-prolyl cis-trans isomerase
LGDPQWDERNMPKTIFGHVVVGFNVLERIRKIKVTKDVVTIVDCGVI